VLEDDTINKEIEKRTGELSDYFYYFMRELDFPVLFLFLLFIIRFTKNKILIKETLVNLMMMIQSLEENVMPAHEKPEIKKEKGISAGYKKLRENRSLVRGAR